MRRIQAEKITGAVRDLCIAANRALPADLESCIRRAAETEPGGTGRAVLGDLCDNMDAARAMRIPICQDTGMAVVFAEIGQEVYIDGAFEAAVHRGVALGYTEGLLRCSVVGDPLRRQNTGDNTPAVLHTRLVPGDKVRLTVAPKGFGSENMSRLQMMTPAATRDDIVRFVCETARLAGANACPPMVIGVGLGGDFELCALLAKKALCRPVSAAHADAYYVALEEELLAAVNGTGIGPGGFGGIATALCVHVEPYPTHIAGLPVAVNIGCHVTRHGTITL